MIKKEGKGVPTKFKKFSPKEFLKWCSLPRMKMADAIVYRNGVKNYDFKPKPKLSHDAEPRILARGNNFYIQEPGRRMRTLRIPVDIRPLPTPNQMKENPDWWHRSKEAGKINAILQYYHSESMMEDSVSLYGSTSSRYRWLRECLERGGFESTVFLWQLEDGMGIDRLVACCEKLSTITEAEAEYLLAGGSLEELNTMPAEERIVLNRKKPKDFKTIIEEHEKFVERWMQNEPTPIDANKTQTQ